MTIKARWERDDTRAILWAGDVAIADVMWIDNSFQAVVGCHIFSSGGITKHATMDEAIKAVESKLTTSAARAAEE